MAAELPTVLLMGPTASGKSGLALELAAQMPVEIVSVDSAQVYRGLDIGSAKPDAETRARVPHHLLDFLDPLESYSAARFRDDALKIIADIKARGRIPLLTGGTMLYFHVLMRGLNDLPSADAQLRQRLEHEASTHGTAEMHRRLTQRDAATAARLHPNDWQRIQRALEIIELSGQTPTEFYAHEKSEPLRGPIIKLALNPPERSVLHARIAKRFEQMMVAGFLDEVAALRARGDLHLDLPAMRAVGYRQLWQHLDGDYDRNAAVQRGIAATRQLAKRQLTWLRSQEDVTVLDPATPQLLAQVLPILR